MLPDTDSLLQECADLEEKLQELRSRYEQFFLGLERKPPTVLHDALKRRMAKLKGSFIRSTALKFKTQSLYATFLTYERLWARTLQEMESGTYRRDLFKARLHKKQREEAEGREAPGAREGADKSLDDALSALTDKPVAKPPPPPRAAAGGTEGGLTDAKLRAVYDAYVKAKRQCNEDTSKLTLDSVAASLKRQVPELLKKHGAKEVDFKVVIKDGKAALRAIPK